MKILITSGGCKVPIDDTSETFRHGDMVETFEEALAILEDIRLRILPVGYLPNHTHKNLPAIIEGHVKRSATLGFLSDEAAELETNIIDETAQGDDILGFIIRVIESG